MKSLTLNSSITEVLEAMKFQQDTKMPSGFAVVTDEEGSAVGVISDSDLRRIFLTTGVSKDSLLAKDLMRKDFIYLFDKELEVSNFSRLSKMIKSREIENKISVQFIPIVNKEMKLIRILHITDLIESWNDLESQIVIIGLGFVGLTLALAFADRHKLVLGIDIDKKYISELQSHKSRIYEPDLSTILKRTLNTKLILRNELSTYSREQNQQPRNYIICVGTPLINGNLDMSQLEAAIKLVSADLQKGDTVIFRSTVPVGFTREAGRQIQIQTNLQAGIDFALCYAPERTVEGNAIKECSTIPQIYSGLTENCSIKASQIFKHITDSQIKTESLEACELGKLMTNAFRDVTFGFANEMATIAKNFNLDINRLIENVNSGYARNQIAKPSPGVGGPCLSKDSYILAEVHKSSNSILLAARNINEQLPIDLAKNLVEISKSSAIINVLIVGIAFKGEPETNDTRNSTSLIIARKLAESGLSLRILDSIVSNSQIEEIGFVPYSKHDNWHPSLVCILNNHKQNSFYFKSIIDLDDLRDPISLFDPWYLCSNLYDDVRIKQVLTISKNIIHG